MVESLNSWANAITAMRILLAPLVFLAIPEDGTGSWWAFLLWFILCSSDGIDGYIARRRGPTGSRCVSRPARRQGARSRRDVHARRARHLLVGPGGRSSLHAELAISAYRIIKSGRGISVPASRLGKYKTVVQQFAVAFALFPPTALAATWTWQLLLWIAVVLTVVSGVQYFWHAMKTQPADLTTTVP